MEGSVCVISFQFILYCMGVYGCVLLFLEVTCVFLLNKIGCSVDTDIFMLLLLIGTRYFALLVSFFHILW
jgi:hypothetical protein